MNNLSIRRMTAISKKKKKGFTLVELIIVIAIIAILAAMAIPKFSSIRIDAKVSNDVVAAKNIQTQVQMAIANGTINEKSVASTEVGSDIYGKLDGSVGSDGLAEAIRADHFYYVVDANGDVQVSVGTATTQYQLAPEIAGDTGRAGYAAAAQ